MLSARSKPWFSLSSSWRRPRPLPAYRSSRTYTNETRFWKRLPTAADPSQRLGLVLCGVALSGGVIAYILYFRKPRSISSVDGHLEVPVLNIKSLQDPRFALQTPPLSPEQVDERLRADEATCQISGLNIGRYDRTTLPSNSAMEDAHAEAVIEMPDGRKVGFWGIYDGHIGPAMSSALSRSLIHAVALEIGEMDLSEITPPFESIAQAIKRAFLTVDDYFVWERREELLQHIPPDSSITQDRLSLPAARLLKEAFTGSCALLSMYDSQSRVFHVALAGDSRAVLGRRSEQDTWTATVLSLDQCGSNPDEQARIRARHPGEIDVLKNGRLLGSLEPTRAFGDLFYKWTDEMQTTVRMCYLNDGNLGRQQAPNATPPYLTAEPVVTSVQIQPERGDFVVMASDGLWELLGNEEVVALVGRWIDEQKDIGSGKGRRGWEPYISSVKSTVLNGGSTSQKRPLHSGLISIHPDERFVLEDRNAATHLLRNALGGQLHDGQMVRAMLTLPTPLSRRYRDDLTVMVIFFGDSPNATNTT